MNSKSEHRQAARLSLQVFDVAVEIQSDSAEYLAPFARMYERFRRPEGAAPRGRPLPVQLLTHPGSPWEKPVLIVGGRATRLERAWLAGGYPFELIHSAVLAAVGSHVLIHAGAVSGPNGAVILCGDSGHGKTTLTLRLVERGFGFLSDDIAALGREDGLLHPYPRGLNLRPETLDLVGPSGDLEDSFRWRDSTLADIDGIHPGALADPAPVRQVVFLMETSPEPRPTGDSSPRPLGVLVDRAEEPLLEGVRRIRAVARMRTEEDRGYPLIRVWTKRRHAVLEDIQTLCAQQGVRVLDVIRRPLQVPEFQPETSLKPVPASHALMELLRRFQGGPDSRLVQTAYQGNATRLFLELMSLLDGVDFYRLTPGPLDEMADEVCELAA